MKLNLPMVCKPRKWACLQSDKKVRTQYASGIHKLHTKFKRSFPRHESSMHDNPNDKFMLRHQTW